jgi:hypothetical protein
MSKVSHHTVAKTTLVLLTFAVLVMYFDYWYLPYIFCAPCREFLVL